MRKLFGIGLVTFLLLVPAVAAHTQTAGMSISPVSQSLTAEPGEQLSTTLSVTNVSPTDVMVVEFSARDFNPGLRGTPEILTADESNEFGLSDWFVETGDATIGPGSSIDQQIRLNVPADALNQTYYGVVLVSDATSTDSELSPSSGMLVFVDVGTPQYQASVQSFSTSDRNFSATSGSATFEIEISNDGQYRFTPIFFVEIRDSADNLVRTVRPESEGLVVGSVLPQSTRQYSLSFTSQEMSENESYVARLFAALPNDQTITSDDAPSVSFEAIAEPQDSTEPTGTDADTTDEDGSSTVALLAAGAGGGLVLLGVVALLLRKRKSQHHMPAASQNPEHQPTTFTPENMPQQPPNLQPQQPPNQDQP